MFKENAGNVRRCWVVCVDQRYTRILEIQVLSGPTNSLFDIDNRYVLSRFIVV